MHQGCRLSGVRGPGSTDAEAVCRGEQRRDAKQAGQERTKDGARVAFTMTQEKKKQSWGWTLK